MKARFTVRLAGGKAGVMHQLPDFLRYCTLLPAGRFLSFYAHRPILPFPVQRSLYMIDLPSKNHNGTESRVQYEPCLLWREEGRSRRSDQCALDTTDREKQDHLGNHAGNSL